MKIPLRPDAVRQLIRNNRFQVCLLKGKERSTRCDLTLAVVGSSVDVEYLASLAFDGDCERVNLQKIWSWRICRLAKTLRKSADLLFMVNVDPEKAKSLQTCDSGFFYLPRFVSGEVEFSTAHLQMQKKKCKV